MTATGLSIYGLSRDSPKSNTTFKTNKKLPYTLLCDPAASLIGAIGMKKAPSGTTRGVFAVDKAGKVLAAEAGGPAATVDVIRKLVAEGGPSTDGVTADSETKENEGDKEEEAAPEAITAGGVDDAEASNEGEEMAALAATEEKTEGDAANSAGNAPANALSNGDQEMKDADAEKAEVAAEVADTAAKLDADGTATI